MQAKIDMQRNQRAFDYAIAQQRLEGLVVSETTLSDMQRLVCGEITSTEAIENIYRQFNTDISIFQPR